MRLSPLSGQLHMAPSAGLAGKAHDLEAVVTPRARRPRLVPVFG
jgi:hypothetical protein